ncbi:flavohemoprotein [Streptomyces chrestomyceticus JCM 4735]|uniref:nitric oxide dioxygenase n=1 Tax=Streptomyces chrestomyceticus JCM 4735 TaxID=1306181 RepID=A0A7U9PYS5_9ACTN|nr:globin domain-containing protein [Streptomyces chrestomyceticus]GCD36065.1 flavohemoprotein [Streptomyces chrestomyceticus JCM 4735]
MSGVNDDYHALLARHEAMRLRRRILSPREDAVQERPTYGGQSNGPNGPSGSPRALGKPAIHSGNVSGTTGRYPGDPYGEARTDASGDAYDGAADQRVITEYLELVTPFGELITHLYDAMFRRWPYLRSLFPESMEFQRAHLARAFWYLIENLHRPDDIAEVFGRLGRDHRKLGVRPVHFEAFEAALCEALRRTAGPRWAEAVEQAWVRMLRFAVAAMVSGAEAALAEPPYWQATVTAHERRRPDLAVLRVRPHEPYPYRAGQYAALESPRLPQAWRQYSIACAPRSDAELEFHVRQTCTGGVSEALVADTAVGDTLRVGPPRGSMTLDDELASDLVLVAADTGWAPVKALLEELSARRGHRSVRLFLGAHSFADLYDAGAPSELERGRPWLRVTPVIGRRPETGGSFGPDAYGYDALAETVADAVTRHTDWSGHLAYVSGPTAVVDTTVARLTAAGVPPQNIRHDPLSDILRPPSRPGEAAGDPAAGGPAVVSRSRGASAGRRTTASTTFEGADS